jgi:N-acyl-D-amino-acid deacylase
MTQMTTSRRFRVRRMATALALTALAACGGTATGTGPPPVTGSLRVSPAQEYLVVHDTLSLAVTDGSGSRVESGIEWRSSAPGVVAVDAAGRATALAAGQATITASDGDRDGRAYFTVVHGGGHRVPGLSAFDSIIPQVMARWGIPGGSIAVARDGRLVLARSYGLADTVGRVAPDPTTRFRIASVSKPVTAVAIMRLVEQNRLALDARAFDLLPDLVPPTGQTPDSRIADITVRQLLLHAGGWDREATFDPMFRPLVAAQAVGAPAPASAETVVRYMLGQPLQFDPGDRYAYSNLGYAVLGRIVERVTGESYEDFVRDEILAPMGISRMHIGATRPEDRADGEARYYDPAFAPSVFPGEGTVAFPDGGFYLEAMDAHGGWVASAVDLVRFATAVDGRGGRADLLLPASIGTMTARPPAPLWVGSPFFYSLGWLVRPEAGDANWWHNGSLPGTSALLVRASNGLVWAALFNARASTTTGSFDADLDQAIWRAVGAASRWPVHDLFSEHP